MTIRYLIPPQLFLSMEKILNNLNKKQRINPLKNTVFRGKKGRLAGT